MFTKGPALHCHLQTWCFHATYRTNIDEVRLVPKVQQSPINPVMEMISSRPEGLDIILTGRYAPDELIELADTVTEMKEIKHHYNSGIQMRKGIEF